MATKGDKILDKSLPKIGEKSLFTEELELALESGRVDFVVHSLKDLPTSLPEGMALGAILNVLLFQNVVYLKFKLAIKLPYYSIPLPYKENVIMISDPFHNCKCILYIEREDPRDAVVMSKKYKDKTLSTLPEGSVIGTSSLRRSAQLARNMPHLKVENIRGNLNTRLRKLDDENGPFAAIILAAAGLKRLNWENRISQLLEPEEALYAVGQGALGVECRETDWKILSLLEPLYDIETTLRCVCERSFLKTLGGGCSAPVAVSSTLKNKILTVTGAVWSLDGQKLVKGTSESKLYMPDDDGEPPKKCPYREPQLYCSVAPGKVSNLSLLGAEQLGKDLGKVLIEKNALDVMAEARNTILNSK
ncbi:hypothetical protein E2986_06251 [Frieseomelitta varia]|uniref:hydroxymethylbilane synthase n=1 Tax=Frieseomelitta varia TaxID=561572 RepID=A0A833S3B9_9HYME|nr:hypothetical protein E2986_06251 [Frieseomelitta varia]